jgi:hypothetical protein
MGWFGADKEINAVGNVIEKTGGAFDALFTSDEERLTKAEAMARIKQKPDEWAHQLNMLNAQSSSLFVSGWRPAMGWVCVIAALLYFVPQFAIGAGLWVYQCYEMIKAGGAELPAYPVSDSNLWELVAIMFGGGVLRTIEKVNGVARR